MGDEKLTIAVRFFGGAGNYTDVLERFCKHVLADSPSEAAAIDWIRSNTRATSDDGIRRRLAFLERIGLLEIESGRIRLTQRGMEWLSETDPAVLYELLAEHVRGFDTILEALLDGPKTDAELGDAIESEHAEVDWNDAAGPAQHRGWLQSLGYVERSDGVNSLTDPGRELARRRTSDAPDLERGEFYTQSELEAVLDTSFGAYIKGINPRTDENGDLEFVVVKAREDGPYADDLADERFTYIGEGLPEKGDQRRTAANNALVEQAERSTVPVYFFYHPADRDDLRYEGLVDVVDAEYVSRDGRMVYEFTMERLDLEHPAAFQTLAASVTDEADDDTEEPALTDADEDYTTVQRRVRSSAFRSEVKSAYEHRCAICGAARKAPDGTRDIEAAHIYPKRENGRDTIRNGLALCRLHHWAFDAGWLAISDDYRVLVADRPNLEGYEEFAALENEALKLPTDENKRPHAAFLAAHRERHGFE
ncbi:HNH endonuclease [Halopiger xanaduensis]|uniref:Restriction endonuclease-like protein n=1 Tax=Halopiger xanaduensis (strain DSM 18323 / JCM 14033 / SH-6) TaxID=797210 RepID=F8DA99_HALXS|nr:HNH endonuclease [Halopiger xanaduensis]AEH38176.1 restriction endonuclease-like protein [Halopiger xanaduensis SH-6]